VSEGVSRLSSPPPISSRPPSIPSSPRPIFLGLVSDIHTKQVDDELIINSNLKYFQRGCIMLDGSNIAYLIQNRRRDNSGPRLSTVEEVMQKILDLGIPRDRIMIVFDANIEHVLPPLESQKVRQYEKEQIANIAPSGTKADKVILCMAEQLRRKFIVFSKDTYKDRPTWFRCHRIAVTLDPEEHPILLFSNTQDLIHAFHGLESLEDSEEVGNSA